MLTAALAATVVLLARASDAATDHGGVQVCASSSLRTVSQPIPGLFASSGRTSVRRNSSSGRAAFQALSAKVTATRGDVAAVATDTPTCGAAKACLGSALQSLSGAIGYAIRATGKKAKQSDVPVAVRALGRARSAYAACAAFSIVEGGSSCADAALKRAVDTTVAQLVTASRRTVSRNSSSGRRYFQSLSAKIGAAITALPATTPPSSLCTRARACVADGLRALQGGVGYAIRATGKRASHNDVTVAVSKLAAERAALEECKTTAPVTAPSPTPPPSPPPPTPPSPPAPPAPPTTTTATTTTSTTTTTVTTPAPESFRIAVGDDVGPNSPQQGEGDLELPGSVDVYSFSRTRDDQRIFLDLQTECSTTPDLEWTLQKPDHTDAFADVALQSCAGDRGPITLDQVGDYQLTVFTPAGSPATGSYHFKLWDVPDEPTDPVAVDAADRSAGQIATPGAGHRYTFTATPGEKVLLDLQGVNGACAGSPTTLTLTLRRQDGSATPVAPTSMAVCQDPEPVTLDAGAYEVDVRAPVNDDGTASYAFRLRDVTHWDAFAIHDDDTVDDGAPGPGAGRLESSAAVDAYSFEAIAGQKAFFDIQHIGTTPDCDFSDMTWALEKPDGTTAFSGVGLGLCQGDRGPVTLDQSGTYRLLVSEPSNSTETKAYRFRLTSVDPPDVSAIAYGDTVNGNIEKPGQEDDYTFTATAGDRAFFDIQHIGTTSDCDFSDLGWTLVEPDGTTTLFDAVGLGLCQGDRGPVTLPVSGRYTLRVAAPFNNDEFQAYRFRLTSVDPPDVSAIAYGDTVNGDIEKPGQEDDYTFSASAGDHASFDIQHTGSTPDCDFSGLQWTLTAPDGTTKPFANIGLGLCAGDQTVTLPQTGTYTLRVAAPVNDDEFQSYRFALSKASVTVKGWSTTPSSDWTSTGTLPAGATADSGTITSCPDTADVTLYFDYAGLPSDARVTSRWSVDGATTIGLSPTAFDVAVAGSSGHGQKAGEFVAPAPDGAYEVELVLGQAVLATAHVTRNCAPEAVVHGWGTQTNSSWPTDAMLPSGAVTDAGTLSSCAQTDPLVAYVAYSGWPASVDITWTNNGTILSSTTQSVAEPSGDLAELAYPNGATANGSWQLTITPAGGGATLLQGTVTRDC